MEKVEDNKINVRIPDGTGYGLSDIDAKAKSLGLNKSEFIMKGINMMMNFDEVFLKKVQAYSKGPEWLTLQNLIIRRMAQDDANAHVWGTHSEALYEFISTNDGTGYKSVTGEPLYNILKKMFIEDEEKEKVKVLLDNEKYGLRVNENDKKLLIKYRVGQAWLESDEYKEVLERKAYVEKFKADHSIVDEPEFDRDEWVTHEELDGWHK